MALARDELHPAQDEAAAALAQLGGRGGAAQQAAVLRAAKGGGEGAADAIESFVLMLRRGGAISREQAALGVCHLCRSSAQSTAKERRAMSGRPSRRAPSPPSSRAPTRQPQVARAAAAALAALTEDAGAAVALM